MTLSESDKVRAAWLCQQVNQELLRALKASGMTRSDLARALGYNAGWVTVQLRGRNLSLRAISQIAHALGMRVEFKLVPNDKPAVLGRATHHQKAKAGGGC